MLLVLLESNGLFRGWFGVSIGELGIAGIVMVLSLLGTLAFWGAIIVAAVLVFRALSGKPRAMADSGETALDILERRYAAGELTREQFLEMRADLGH